MHQKHKNTVTQNKVKEVKDVQVWSPCMNDLWPGNWAGLFSKEMIRKKWRKKDKWRNIRCKQANNIYSAEINKWIKGTILPGASTGPPNSKPVATIPCEIVTLITNSGQSHFMHHPGNYNYTSQTTSQVKLVNIYLLQLHITNITV